MLCGRLGWFQVRVRISMTMHACSPDTYEALRGCCTALECALCVSAAAVCEHVQGNRGQQPHVRAWHVLTHCGAACAGGLLCLGPSRFHRSACCSAVCPSLGGRGSLTGREAWQQCARLPRPLPAAATYLQRQRSRSVQARRRRCKVHGTAAAPDHWQLQQTACCAQMRQHCTDRPEHCNASFRWGCAVPHVCACVWVCVCVCMCVCVVGRGGNCTSARTEVCATFLQ
jgi:hypothetical protein